MCSTVRVWKYFEVNRKFKGEPSLWVVKEIVGLQLCHAFVIARAVGIKLRVNTIDGKLATPKSEIDKRLSVDVFDCVVRKAWN